MYMYLSINLHVTYKPALRGAYKYGQEQRSYIELLKLRRSLRIFIYHKKQQAELTLQFG